MTIKKQFERLRRGFVSLRVRFVAIFLLAAAFATLCFFISRTISNNYINDIYLSDENKAKREAEYHESLQQYIDEKNITFENIDRVSEWQKKNQYVYLMIYKEQTDDEALFIPDDSVDSSPTPSPDGSSPSDTAPDSSGGEDTDLTPDGDGQAPDTDTEGGELPDDSSENTDSADTGGGEADDSLGGTIGGITVDLPTKSELQEAAKKLNMLFIELPENQYVYARFAEFTEYLYYDIANIGSLIFAVIVALLILLLYITRVTLRIGKLGAAVNRVASGDTERKISVSGGDEISELAGNVESMRSTMVENYKREKEALDSNTELITSMSHDIRTPLTVLLGYIDVMRQNAKGDGQMLEYLKAAESTAMRLKKLSDDMFGYFLVFGRDERQLCIEVYDVLTLFEQMLSEHVLLMNENGYVTQLSFHEGGLSGKLIRTDAQSLVRIFDNIFSNMYKYADREQPVKIDVCEDNGRARVSFLNTIRRDGEAVESNGIGLKTCKKLAEHMGAEFDVRKSGDTFVSELFFDFYDGEATDEQPTDSID